MKTPLPYPALVAALGALLAALILLSMLIGPSWTGTLELARAFRGGDSELVRLIMVEIRLPRTLLAAAVGFTLGLAGAVLQGLLRNPLADPGVIGVSPAAALGAVLAIYSGFAAAFPLALPVAAILGALAAAATLQGVAARGGMLTLILAGVAIGSLAATLTSLALNLSPNPYAAQEIIFWMLGSVTDRSLDHVALAVPFMLGGWALLFRTAPALDALSLGEDAAASLGVDLRRTRLAAIGGAAIAVGAATAVSGVIGFIGLVIPHLMRPLVGHRPARLLLASGLAGGALLVGADILVRLLTPGSELRLGVVTAILGAPFFLWLVLRARAELES